MSTSDDDRGLSGFFSLLANPVVLELIEQVGFRHHSMPGLAEKLGRSPATISKYTNRLDAWGIMKRVKVGRRLRYGLKDREVLKIIQRGRKCLQALKPEGDPGIEG